MNLRARIEALPTPSVRLQRTVAAAVVATQALIAVTGSVVRVTGSGLGCPTWPNCEPGSLVPVSHDDLATVHQWIEFGNRMLTGVVGVIAVLAFALAWLARPRRQRYLRLALAMPLGVVAQAVLGGITVRMSLAWWTVAVHFLVSTVMVWLAVMLFHAVDEDEGPARTVGPSGVSGLLIAQTAVLGGLLVAGTMVTGAGPHAGDQKTPRLAVPVDTLAHVHAGLMFLFVGMLLGLGFMLRYGGAPQRMWRSYLVLVGVALGQGLLGFVQYWTGVPEALVSMHVLGAMLVIIATATVWCAAHQHRPARLVDTGPALAITGS